MTKNPISVDKDMLGCKSAHYNERKKITSLVFIIKEIN